MKTRLAVSIGDEEACHAYSQIAHHCLNTLSKYPEVELRFAPDEAAGEVALFSKSVRWSLKPQGEGDLGQRMFRAADETLSECDGILILGTDCPYIERDDLDEAITALHTSDLVLGPALDGGYWAIGLRNPHPELFQNIAWSTDQVFNQTCDQAQQLGLSIHELRKLEDVDDLESWRRFQKYLGRSYPS